MPHLGCFKDRREDPPAWNGSLPDGFDLRDIFSGMQRAARIIRRGIDAIVVRYREGVPDPRRHPSFGRRRAKELRLAVRHFDRKGDRSAACLEKEARSWFMLARIYFARLKTGASKIVFPAGTLPYVYC